MTIVAVGIDLAKNVFAVNGVGASGKPELVKPDVKRKKLRFANTVKVLDFGTSSSIKTP